MWLSLRRMSKGTEAEFRKGTWAPFPLSSFSFGAKHGGRASETVLGKGFEK